jgi:hypothetical protein
MNYLQIPGDAAAIIWRGDNGNSGVIRAGDDGWEDYLQWCANGNTAQVYGPLARADEAQDERIWRDSELARADCEIFKHDDGETGAIATVSAWRTYRKELRAWPTHESFPDSLMRPRLPA